MHWMKIPFTEGAPAAANTAAQPSGTIEIVAESGEMTDTAKLSINDLQNGKVAVIGGADGPTAIYIAEKADGRPGLNPGIPAEDAAADRDEETANLAQRLTASGDFTHASALAFLVFILLYFPCIATVAAIGSEAGWRWAFASVAYNTLLAWLAAWAVYHLVMWL